MDEETQPLPLVRSAVVRHCRTCGRRVPDRPPQHLPCGHRSACAGYGPWNTNGVLYQPGVGGPAWRGCCDAAARGLVPDGPPELVTAPATSAQG